MAEALPAASWGQAIAMARQIGDETPVIVSKAVEPALPDHLEVTASNFPYSLHKGAFRVYRESTPGRHLQIREYTDHWELTLDSNNPHYRPLSHARGDVPAGSVATLPTFLAVRGLGTAARLPLEIANFSLQLLSDSKLLTAHRYLPGR
jgi:hypothetical protein